MNKKKLRTQANGSPNSLTIQDLASELVEVSEEELQQVVGGREIKYKDGNITSLDDWYKHNT